MSRDFLAHHSSPKLESTQSFIQHFEYTSHFIHFMLVFRNWILTNILPQLQGKGQTPDTYWKGWKTLQSVPVSITIYHL